MFSRTSSQSISSGGTLLLTLIAPTVFSLASAGKYALSITQQLSLDLARWGLVPYWAKDIKVGFANINAKAEGIDHWTRGRYADGNGGARPAQVPSIIRPRTTLPQPSSNSPVRTSEPRSGSVPRLARLKCQLRSRRLP